MATSAGGRPGSQGHGHGFQEAGPAAAWALDSLRVLSLCAAPSSCPQNPSPRSWPVCHSRPPPPHNRIPGREDYMESLPPGPGVAVPAGRVTGLFARGCWAGTTSDLNNCWPLHVWDRLLGWRGCNKALALSCCNRAGCGHRQVRDPLGGRASVGGGQANPTPPSPPRTRIPRAAGPEQTAKLRATVLKLWCLGTCFTMQTPKSPLPR